MKNDSLIGIWHSKDYAAFRERVRKFEFSPCTVCGGCDYRDSNEKTVLKSVPVCSMRFGKVLCSARKKTVRCS